MSKPTPLDSKRKQELINKLNDIDARLGLPIGTSEALFDTESAFKTGQIGQDTQYGRARGLLQVMPGTKRSYEKLYGRTFDVDDIEDASQLYYAIMKDNLKRYPNHDEAIMAYYGGPNKRLWGDKTVNYLTKIISKRDGLFNTLGVPYKNTTGETALSKLQNAVGKADMSGVTTILNSADIDVDSNYKKPDRKMFEPIEPEKTNTIPKKSTIQNAIARMALAKKTQVPDQVLGRDTRGIGMALDTLNAYAGQPSDYLSNNSFTGMTPEDKGAFVTNLEKSKANTLMDAYGIRKGSLDRMLELELGNRKRADELSDKNSLLASKLLELTIARRRQADINKYNTDKNEIMESKFDIFGR